MRLSATLDALCDSALALLYPQACAACGMQSVEARRDSPACAACWAKTRLFSGDDSFCWKCGALAAGAAGEREASAWSCRRCDAQHFTAARACGVYEGALRASVLALKREPNVGGRLARLLCEAQGRPPLDAATRIVPVPLHAERLRERGFNQAQGLGRALSAQSRLALDEWSLVRVSQPAARRAGMDARGRRETVEAAFRVVRPRLIEGERVLLVDDVFTTGATVSECARELREAGAMEVFVLTIARA